MTNVWVIIMPKKIGLNLIIHFIFEIVFLNIQILDKFITVYNLN